MNRDQVIEFNKLPASFRQKILSQPGDFQIMILPDFGLGIPRFFATRADLEFFQTLPTDVVQAVIAGKPIQHRCGGLYSKWTDFAATDSALFSCEQQGREYRVKPPVEKKLRAWKVNEVPIGALIKTYKDGPIQTINGVDPKYSIIRQPAAMLSRVPGKSFSADHYFLSDLVTSTSQPTHSIDGGKTWHRCGIWESVEVENGVFMAPKPVEPVYREWTANEVPVGVTVRLKDGGGVGKPRYVIMSVDFGQIIFGTWKFLPRELLTNWEHSKDFGQTWHPCGVLVPPVSTLGGMPAN